MLNITSLLFLTNALARLFGPMTQNRAKPPPLSRGYGPGIEEYKFIPCPNTFTSSDTCALAVTVEYRFHILPLYRMTVHQKRDRGWCSRPCLDLPEAKTGL